MLVNKIEKAVCVVAGITVCLVLLLMIQMRRSIIHPAEIGITKADLQVEPPPNSHEKARPTKKVSLPKPPSSTAQPQPPSQTTTVIAQTPSKRIMPSHNAVEGKKIDPLFRERYSKYASVFEEVKNAESEWVETPYGPAVRLISVVRGSIVDRIGFAPGDVLVAINGRTLGVLAGSAREGERLYEELRHLELFEVEIIRDGQPVLLQYQIPLK